MTDFQYVPLGVGSAFSALYYSSSLALHAQGSWLLIDCPHPIRKMVREASQSAGVPFSLDNVEAVVLTHLHADHSSGLEMYGYYSHYALKKQAKIYTHPDVAEPLWRGHLAASMEWSIQEAGEAPEQRCLEDFFDVVPLSETQPTTCGPFTIECRKTIHSIPTIALRIRAGDRTLGCSADTAYDPSLIEWLDEADSIIHETGRGGLHTPYEHLAALSESTRAKMRLIHYPDDFDKNASAIETLEQGRCYQV